MTNRMTLVETERAIKTIKDVFEDALAKKLNLLRVSAPLFVEQSTGINDHLNGTERPVSFDHKGITLEIVQSLAKWKRLALYRYAISPGEGLYTDMNAIRMDETLTDIHSLYVDQWDWEKVITADERHETTLFTTVKTIYDVLLLTLNHIQATVPSLTLRLPKDITMIDSKTLRHTYPTLSVKAREDRIAQAHGAVFITGIGDHDDQGLVHDKRSPDYDDWSLNGDILVWNPVLNRAFELSSMGIRVDRKALIRQLERTQTTERQSLPYHKMILDGKLPQTIGGGIGQSRMCMLFLEKRHIGEVQSAYWPDEMIAQAIKDDIFLL